MEEIKSDWSISWALGDFEETVLSLSQWSPGGYSVLMESHRSRLLKGQGATAVERLERWRQIPSVGEWSIEEGAPTIKLSENLKAGLMEMMPWRKGPWAFGDLWVDSEWDSRIKWERIVCLLPPLEGRSVLDLGCGNGWYLWRLLELGADRVLGMDPMPQYWAQFHAFQHLAQDPRLTFVLGGHEEALESNLRVDVLLCMGVLYHRRDPVLFLKELRTMLNPGGHLLLETIVLPGEDRDVLHPERYASMRNCWSLPTVTLLGEWLEMAGWNIVEWGELAPTTLAEQRQTEWIKSLSLDAFLDPANPGYTVEGHPAPHRIAVLVNSVENRGIK